MRTNTTEVMVGRAGGTGIAYEGPCTVQRVSAGKYNLYPPPGRRIIGVSALPFAPAQWLMIKCDITGNSAQITFANTAPTESDTGFIYTIILAA